MRSAVHVSAALSLACLAAALVWPGVAERVLLGLVLFLSLAYVGARIHRVRLPAAMTSDTYTPFDRVEQSLAPRQTPALIDGLTEQLRASEDPLLARQVPIPSSAHKLLASEVVRRLAERHGLYPSRPADHPRIEALVSEATWRLIRPTENGRRSLAFRDPVSLEHLPTVLRDAERL